MTAPEMTWIAPVYLKILMDRAAANPEPPEDPALTNEALQYAEKALNGEVPAPEHDAATEPPPPPGQFARVELPGFVDHTGWLTKEAQEGVLTFVIRDWDGHVTAEVSPNAYRRIVYLPTPLKRPDPQVALPAGEGFGYEIDDETPEDPRPF